MKVSDRIAQIDDILEDHEESFDLRSDNDFQDEEQAKNEELKRDSMVEREKEEQKVLDELKNQIAQIKQDN